MKIFSELGIEGMILFLFLLGILMLKSVGVLVKSNVYVGRAQGPLLLGRMLPLIALLSNSRVGESIY